MAQLEARQIDPGREHLGRVYAKALLAAAAEAGEESRVVEELQDFAWKVLESLPKLKAFLESPRVTIEEKHAVLERAIGSRASVTLLRFLKIVARRGRMDALREMAVAARELYNEEQGIVAVTVRTAFPLEDTTVSQLEASLEKALGHKVQLRVEVDRSLVGGLVLQIGDRVYDGSAIARLQRMHQQVREHTFQQIRSAVDRFADGA